MCFLYLKAHFLKSAPVLQQNEAPRALRESRRVLASLPQTLLIKACHSSESSFVALSDQFEVYWVLEISAEAEASTLYHQEVIADKKSFKS